MKLNLNSEYWLNRSIQRVEHIESRAENLNDRLVKEYRKALRNIDTELRLFYEKYSKENGLTYKEATQRLNPKELRIFRENQDIYLEEYAKYKDLGYPKEYENYIRNLSKRAYISRLQQLQASIKYQIEMLGVKQYNLTKKELITCYEDSYYITQFDMQKGFGFGYSFTRPSLKQMKVAIQTPWLGDNFSSRIWKNKEKLLIKLDVLIGQEFVRGRGVNKLSEELANIINTSLSNAQRLVRSETNAIANQAGLNALENVGFLEEYEFLATLDSVTSPQCRQADGKRIPIKNAMMGINIPPLHVNCRSTIIPYFPPDEFDEIEQRVARDEITQKSIFLDKSPTFFEWVNEYGSDGFKKRVNKEQDVFYKYNKISKF